MRMKEEKVTMSCLASTSPVIPHSLSSHPKKQLYAQNLTSLTSNTSVNHPWQPHWTITSRHISCITSEVIIRFLASHQWRKTTVSLESYVPDSQCLGEPPIVPSLNSCSLSHTLPHFYGLLSFHMVPSVNKNNCTFRISRF